MPVPLPFSFVSSMEDVQANMETIAVDAIGVAENVNVFQSALSIASGATASFTYTGAWTLTTSPQNFVVIVNCLDTANTEKVSWTITATTASSITLKFYNSFTATATGTALVTVLTI